MPRRFEQLLVENVQPRPGRGGWHGGATPLGAIRGLSAAQAAWVPAPGRKSIWALTLHIAYWKYAVCRRLERAIARPQMPGGARFPRTPSNWPSVPDAADERAWRADVALLRAEHTRLVEVISRVPARQYAAVVPGGKRWTLGELMLGIAQHDAYHAGQIQMLKRLRFSVRSRSRRGARAAR